MVKSVVFEFHWTPDFINLMYLDNYDVDGLFYWYDEIEKMHEKIKEKTKQN